MKPRAKTIIEKHGFLDPDRASLKHDDIQLWVYSNVDKVLKNFCSPGNTIEVQSRILEKAIINDSRFNVSIVGYVDLYVIGFVISSSGERRRFDASIEVKSCIESCGDLIRQVNFYRKYEPLQTTWIVVSPDDRFRKVLLEQGIYFYKYKSPDQLF